MSLGQRTARHETLAAARTAGVKSEDYWDFKPGQKVMTADGFAGVVASVDDGPFAGSETYEVVLDNNLGGGQYTASLLRAMPRAQANVDVKTAADDYPELGSILEDRPPLAISIASSLHVQAHDANEERPGVEAKCQHEGCTRPQVPGAKVCSGHMRSQASVSDDFGDDEREHVPDCTACGGSGEVSDKECARCNGSGDEPLHKSSSKVCPDCNGDGEHGTHQNYWGQWDTKQCPTCGGEGEVPDDYKPDDDDSHRTSSLQSEAAWGRSPAAPSAAHVPTGKARCEGCGWKGDRDSVPASLTCPNCDSDSVSLGARDYTKYPDARTPSGYGRTAAYNEGDPDKYTSSHRCPECGSDRALESANGVIKCEDCGHEEQNGQADGWTKQANALDHARKRVDDFLNTYVRSPEEKAPVDDDLRGLSVDTNGLWPDRGRAKASDHGRTAHIDDSWRDYYAKPAPTLHPLDTHQPGHIQTCPSCGRTQPANHGGVCAQCGTQMVHTTPKDYGRTASRDPFDLVVVAATDPEFRFHVTASYADVRSKAKRLRAEGRVNIISVQGGTMVANVKGDHAVYETEIVNQPGKRAVAQWHCGCKWGAYAWGRQGAFKRFEGRLCSHALALHFEAQSQGMFGRQVTEEQKTPDWLRPRTRVVVDFDRDDRRNVSRPAQPRKRDFMRTYSLVQEQESPVSTLVRTALAEGIPQDEILVSLGTAQIDARGFFSEAGLPGSDPDKKHHRHKGDQAPCARGGCGHPEGLHGDNQATCLSEGCKCRKFTTVPSQPSDKDNSKDSDEAKGNQKAARRKHHHVVEHAHLGGWPLLHGGYFGYGYGLGGCPFCGGGAYAGGVGGDGDGDADDGGTGSDSDGDSDGGGGDGGGGATASRRTAAEIPGTMDPTYTPGNDVRPHDGSHGFWGATSPRDPNANPGSTGWASGGDPEEFNQDSSAFGRMGSLAWPTLQAEAGPQPLPVADHKDEYYNGQTGGYTHNVQHWYNPASWQNVKELEHTGNPFSKPKKPAAAPLTVNPKPLEGYVPVSPGGEAGKIPQVVKTVPKILGDIPQVAKPVEEAASSAGHAVEDAAKGAGHAISDWFKGAPKAEVPKGPSIPKAPESFQAPKEPVRGEPGTATPAKPGSPIAAEPMAEPAPQSATPKGGRGTATEEGSAPKGEGKGGGKPKAPVAADAAAAASRFTLPGLGNIPKPDYYRESFDLIGGHGIGTMRARSSLVFDLLRQEAALTDQERFANGVADNLESLGGPRIPRYLTIDDARAAAGEHAITQQESIKERNHAAIDMEATLNDEPEAALPRTDGMDEDPDGDVDGLAAHGSVDDIVAEFQRTAGAAALVGGADGPAAAGGESDVAAAAQAFLQTEAMKTFSPAEQRSIIDEGREVVASNLDRLDIKGTHYEPLEAALAKASLEDDDDLDW